MDNARKFLESLQRYDLSLLLSQCEAKIKPVESALDWLTDIGEETVVISAPQPIAEALTSLPQQDRKRIAEAVSSGEQTFKTHEDIQVVTEFVGKDANPASSLLAELLIHRAMMVDVATGGARIQDVDDYYRAREVRIREALPPGVTYENLTLTCGIGIAIGAGTCPNTRIAGSTFARYSRPRSKQFRSDRRYRRKSGCLQVGNESIELCPRLAIS